MCKMKHDEAGETQSVGLRDTRIALSLVSPSKPSSSVVGALFSVWAPLGVRRAERLLRAELKSCFLCSRRGP